MKKELTKMQQIERSLITTYKKTIWSKFVKAINEYQLIKDGDKIAVCISGGKDSFVLAKCMQELLRHGRNNFELVFLVMDPGYSNQNRELIIENAKLMGIPIQMFESPIFTVVADVGGNPCYLCARMRRGYLYKEAQQLGCNKIALGHHFDDVIETTLMNMLYSGEIKTMMPKLKSLNFKPMELIRPLYMVKEKDILAFKDYNKLMFLQCACLMTEKIANDNVDSKRQEMKKLIQNFRKINPHIDRNIFQSMHNINLDTVLGTRTNGNVKSFLDNY
ncbi:tRNA 2-thiocytidine(32) synthetase TtcA [Candidatus Epulonipiscium viviparus]|uniref:tRNA 2-thiocytidine(32) synthetase TtcA n=1 Tax=Candidatus Epulonipiscium viviparus TaxID=420336 RepID=UPI00016C0C63|nr:tRNA 2-thiocytidine(32) synthetase TtcA [Candidatus Epulopiscium viviparus]